MKKKPASRRTRSAQKVEESSKKNEVGATTTQRKFQVMTLDELVSARPVPAAGRMPDNLNDLRDPGSCLIESEAEPSITVSKKRLSAERESKLWRVSIRANGKPLLPGLLGKSREQLRKQELTSTLQHATHVEAYRPAWMALEYLPRIIPNRVSLVSRRARRLRELSFIESSLLRALRVQHVLSVQEALSRSWPWNTIGKVFSGTGTNFDNANTTGTGVLVGRNLLLTASHLAPWGASPWWIRFVPGYNDRYEKDDNKEPFGHSYVEQFRGIKGDGSPSGVDYIICKLYTPLGEMLGWMGSQSFGDEDDYYDGRWISVGYPGVFENGQKPAVEFDIDIDDIDNDGDGLELETNYNDAFGGGWSGGPLWGWINGGPKVIGIKSGWEVDGYDPARGVFAGGKHMVDLVKHGIANWQ